MTGRVVVLGGGYAGVVAANTLARRRFEVTLVNPIPFFVERVRLHRVAAGHRDHARVPFEKILHSGISLVIDRARRIDASHHAVQLASGARIGYDWLVYAVGSGERSASTDRHSVANDAAAACLAEALAHQSRQETTVVGAGLTGVETAAALATAGRQVELISRDLFPTDTYHRHVHARLTSLGVEVSTGSLGDAARRGGILIDATGLQPPPLARLSGLPVDERGRLVVKPDLRTSAHPSIVGAGDATYVTGGDATHLRMSCATALPMGAHAARTIIEMSRGRTPEPFRHRYAIQCLDLGGAVGRIQFVTAKDDHRPFALTSVLGGLGKELVVRSTVGTMRRARRGRA